MQVCTPLFYIITTSVEQSVPAGN